MSLSAPLTLDANHRLEKFDCGKPALTDWLQRHARQSQGSGSAKTFVACDGDRVAGYFSLTVGQIDTLDAPERIRRGMGQYPIPLVILARLAVDLEYQGQGLGFSLLQDAIRRTLAIAEQAGIRAVLTHPIDEDAEAFYRRFGFESTPAHERQLILLSRMLGVLLERHSLFSLCPRRRSSRLRAKRSMPGTTTVSPSRCWRPPIPTMAKAAKAC